MQLIIQNKHLPLSADKARTAFSVPLKLKLTDKINRLEDRLRLSAYDNYLNVLKRPKSIKFVIFFSRIATPVK